jgi:hypothetical protein
MLMTEESEAERRRVQSATEGDEDKIRSVTVDEEQLPGAIFLGGTQRGIWRLLSGATMLGGQRRQIDPCMQGARQILNYS